MEKPFEPVGFRFIDAHYGQLVFVEEGAFKDWLCYRHPDGGWVSLREATEQDREKIAALKDDKARVEAEFVEWNNRRAKTEG